MASFVSRARIVGPGFIWLTAGAAAVIGVAGALGEGAGWARVGLVAAILGGVWARSHARASASLAIAGVGFVIQAAASGGLVAAATAALALGGVTGEMMLGHWYLVDPRLPRWALRSLAIVGILGIVSDGALVASLGSLGGGGAAVAFWALLGTSALLMAGVIGAIRYPAYSGVMAATGLSYLAVLTTLGAVFLGRALVAGIGPFST